eukprot:m51a1_g2279 hypothetical protein (210) ;mRNA; f:381454-382083
MWMTPVLWAARVGMLAAFVLPFYQAPGASIPTSPASVLCSVSLAACRVLPGADSHDGAAACALVLEPCALGGFLPVRDLSNARSAEAVVAAAHERYETIAGSPPERAALASARAAVTAFAWAAVVVALLKSDARMALVGLSAMSLGIVAWGVPCGRGDVGKHAGFWIASATSLMYLMAESMARNARLRADIAAACDRIKKRQDGLLKED